MVCIYCKETQPQFCLFSKRNDFNENNWDCKTLQKVKDYATVHGHVYKDELSDGILYVLPTLTDGYVLIYSLQEHNHCTKIVLLNNKGIHRLKQKKLGYLTRKYEYGYKTEVK